MEVVAFCDGLNGSDGMPAYVVYLSSRVAKKFGYDKAFSALGVHLGMFKLDAEKKLLRTFDKSGGCFHLTEEFAVLNNVPREVFAEEEDATLPDETTVKITTKRLVNGKWQTKIMYKKRGIRVALGLLIPLLGQWLRARTNANQVRVFIAAHRRSGGFTLFRFEPSCLFVLLLL